MTSPLVSEASNAGAGQTLLPGSDIIRHVGRGGAVRWEHVSSMQSYEQLHYNAIIAVQPFFLFVFEQERFNIGIILNIKPLESSIYYEM